MDGRWLSPILRASALYDWLAFALLLVLARGFGEVLRRWGHPPLVGEILIGVLLAWLLSYFIKPYITGAETVPVWLPPLPLATVAITLFIYGGMVWVRGNDALPQPDFHDGDHH